MFPTDVQKRSTPPVPSKLGIYTPNVGSSPHVLVRLQSFTLTHRYLCRLLPLSIPQLSTRIFSMTICIYVAIRQSRSVEAGNFPYLLWRLQITEVARWKTMHKFARAPPQNSVRNQTLPVDVPHCVLLQRDEPESDCHCATESVRKTVESCAGRRCGESEAISPTR